MKLTENVGFNLINTSIYKVNCMFHRRILFSLHFLTKTLLNGGLRNPKKKGFLIFFLNIPCKIKGASYTPVRLIWREIWYM